MSNGRLCELHFDRDGINLVLSFTSCPVGLFVDFSVEQPNSRLYLSSLSIADISMFVFIHMKKDTDCWKLLEKESFGVEAKFKADQTDIDVKWDFFYENFLYFFF